MLAGTTLFISGFHMCKIRLALTVGVLALTCAPTWGATCPALLQDARRLILVMAPTMNTVAATARLFERDAAETQWREVHPAEPVVLGLSGMAWGHTFHELARDNEPFKAEGDKRTPAGIYRTGRTFGFAPSQRPNYLQVIDDTVCVDDPSSPAYNTITSRTQIGPRIHAEAMGGTKLYRRGLTIDYPTDNAAAAGSCFFIHVWRASTRGTAGCAMPEPRVAAFQDFVEEGAVIAVLPESALVHFESCLPDVSRDSESDAPPE
jgi:L,D-peptidoglycan transpeptidase YkuD (ErfK/YbiS/YcfS/YnhG family)